MRNTSCWLLAGCLLGQTTFGSPTVASYPIVTDGASHAAIVLPATPQSDESAAAQELQVHLEKMTGAKVEITSADRIPADRVPVFIGAAAPKELDELVRKESRDPAAFALVADEQGICVRGLSAEGTLFAVYELLEQCGVRWFFPGELGTIVPKTKSLAIRKQSTVQTPSFASRWHNGGLVDRVWGRRMRMGGPLFPGSHGIPLGKDGTFDKHPEYYALVNGKRAGRQLCISNPRVVELAVKELKDYFRKNPTAPWKGLGPNDGGGFCECEHCRALDGGEWDAFSNERSVTDRYIRFFNQLLKGIEGEFPDKKIGFYAYHTYMRPPTREKPDPRIVPALAVIALCRVHGPTNPVCPEKSYYLWLVDAWKKVVPEVYERGYWFNLADPGFPFSLVHRLREEIPLGAKLGLVGWRVETLNHWASETPSLYVAARLMWDSKADVDRLLTDFCDHSFGPAAKPMRQYLEMMDTALRDANFHTGCSFDVPHFYPADLRAKAGALLKQAATLSGEGACRERVRLFELSFAYLEAFISMMEHRNAFRFAEAHEQLQKIDLLRSTLHACQPPMLNPRRAESYLKRFFRLPVEQGFKRTSGGNELVAGLKDEWDFQIDPLGVGEEIGLWRAQASGSNWWKIRTSSLSWSDQGLRYYKGEAWYRQAVTVPERFKGKRVFLWFGGVDEKAKVWLNGKELGISHRSAFVPFEMDATEAIRAGEENVLVVCTVNRTVDELGTGGILAPVMFYAPALGKDARPENVKELQSTFP